MTQRSPSNREIAKLLREIADLLQAKGENVYRTNSYRNAARAVEQTSVAIASIAKKDGLNGIRSIRGIGEKIGGLIKEFLEEGTVELKRSLEKEVPVEKVKEVSAETARIHPPPTLTVPVGVLLGIDREYREKAKAGTLKKIAPRLENPEKRQWLPVMSTTSHGLKFTVMFSNTPAAHKLGKTGDWVVVYYENAKGKGQCTIVTEQRGKRKGERVVRGREDETE